MPDSPESHSVSKRPEKEFEDNHYHDEDDVAPIPTDDGLRRPAVPGKGKSARKLPPPRRRFHED